MDVKLKFDLQLFDDTEQQPDEPTSEQQLEAAKAAAQQQVAGLIARAATAQGKAEGKVAEAQAALDAATEGTEDYTKAQTALDNANAAKSKADDAVTAADELEATINAAETVGAVTEAVNEVKGLVEDAEADVDALTPGGDEHAGGGDEPAGGDDDDDGDDDDGDDDGKDDDKSKTDDTDNTDTTDTSSTTTDTSTGTGTTDTSSTDTGSTDTATTTENGVAQTIGDNASVSNINEAFARASSGANENTVKVLTVGSSGWNSTINMGNGGTNIVAFEAGSAAGGTIDKGKTAGVLAFADTKADLSKITVENYNSTRDTIATTKSLSDYLTKDGSATSNFINPTTGKFGTDLMAKSGSLAAKKKEGLYQAKYSQVDPETGEVGKEVLVVAGSTEAASADFSESKTAIFAMTGNNDVADTVTGSSKGDRFVAGEGDVVNGGAGNDSIRAFNSTVQLASSGEGNDVITNWSEYNADSSANSALNMNGSKGIKDLSLSGFTVVNGKIALNLGDGSENSGATVITTKDGADTFIMQVKTSTETTSGMLANVEDGAIAGSNANKGESAEKVYTTLLVNTGAEGGVVISNENANADAFIGVAGQNNQVSFGSSQKTNIFLGGSGNGEEWGDKAVYTNIYNVKTSDIGASMLINGTGNNATLESAGANDSLWGGLGGSDDLLISGGDGNDVLFVGKDMGNDVVTNATNGDTIVFLGTKMSDALGINTVSDGFNVNFGGNEITVKLADGNSMTDMNNLTAKFDDGEYVYNGSDWILKG